MVFEINQDRRWKIFKLYYAVIFFYCLPFFSLFLFIADQATVNKTEMLFWVIFLVTILPCAVIGLSLCIWGIRKSVKEKSKVNKIIGVIGLGLGLGGIIAGILGLMLIYVVLA